MCRLPWEARRLCRAAALAAGQQESAGEQQGSAGGLRDGSDEADSSAGVVDLEEARSDGEDGAVGGVGELAHHQGAGDEVERFAGAEDDGAEIACSERRSEFERHDSRRAEQIGSR